jgi:hypothetical protein
VRKPGALRRNSNCERKTESGLVNWSWT